MSTVYDPQGDEIGDIAISENQQAQLDVGVRVIVQFHTPQMLRGLLGAHNGYFTLHKQGQRIVADDVVTTKKFIDLQRAIKAARDT